MGAGGAGETEVASAGGVGVALWSVRREGKGGETLSRGFAEFTYSFFKYEMNACVPGSLLNIEDCAMTKPDKILALTEFRSGEGD